MPKVDIGQRGYYRSMTDMLWLGKISSSFKSKNVAVNCMMKKIQDAINLWADNMGNFMDWKIALKICGPSALAAWLFYSLLTNYLETSELFKSNIYLNILALLIVFIFCSFMGWLWIRKSKPSNNSDSLIEGNDISGNEIGTNIEIGSNKKTVKDNKIKNNKVNGDLIIK